MCVCVWSSVIERHQGVYRYSKIVYYYNHDRHFRNYGIGVYFFIIIIYTLKYTMSKCTDMPNMNIVCDRVNARRRFYLLTI